MIYSDELEELGFVFYRSYTMFEDLWFDEYEYRPRNVFSVISKKEFEYDLEDAFISGTFETGRVELFKHGNQYIGTFECEHALLRAMEDNMSNISKPELIELINKFRNKAVCRYTEDQARKILHQIKSSLHQELYLPMSIGLNHFLLGEGISEVVESCDNAIKHLKS